MKLRSTCNLRISTLKDFYLLVQTDFFLTLAALSLFICSTKNNRLFDWYTPQILIGKKLFNENSQHPAQLCVVVTLQVIVLKSLVLSLHSIVGVDCGEEPVFTECPNPFLQG